MSVHVPHISEWEWKVLERRVLIRPVSPLFICAERSWSAPSLRPFSQSNVKSIKKKKAKPTLQRMLGVGMSVMLTFRTCTRAQPHAQSVYLPPPCNPRLWLLLWTQRAQQHALCYLASQPPPSLFFSCHCKALIWFVKQAKVADSLGQPTTPPPSSKRLTILGWWWKQWKQASLFLRKWIIFCQIS